MPYATMDQISGTHRRPVSGAKAGTGADDEEQGRLGGKGDAIAEEYYAVDVALLACKV